MTEISVLSIKQPYASWIVYGSKFCENRTWSTSYRGELFIHASSWSREDGVSLDPDDYDYPVPIGHIIGSVNLLTCRPVEEIERYLGSSSLIEADPELDGAVRALAGEPRNFSGALSGVVCGPQCWLMSDRRPLTTPVETKGKLRVWKFELPE